MFHKRLPATAGLSVFVSAIPGTAQAQEAANIPNDDVVVTASRTGASTVRETPIAITALTSEQLDQRGVNDIRGLADYAPGLQIADFSGYAQIFIRGIGSNDSFAGTDPSSTVHLDGVYLGRTLGYFSSFLDVDRVEVLRGPQGTLYGRNSVGGTINVITRTPTEQLSGEAQIGGGTFNAFNASGYVSGGLGGGIKASIAAQYRSHGNYFDNVSTGGGVGRERNVGVRGQIAIPLGERGEAIIRADYTRQKGRLAGYSKLLGPTGVPTDDAILGDFHKVSLNRTNSEDQKAGGVAVELRYQLSDELTLKSLSSWRKLRGTLSYDPDGSSIDIGRTFVDLHQEQYSEDLSLTAKTGHLTLLAGLFYFQEQVREPLVFSLVAAGVSNFRLPTVKTRSYAAYTQGEFNLTDQLSIVAGLRYTTEKKTLAGDFLWTSSASLNLDQALAAPPLVGVPGFYDPFAADARNTYHAWTPKIGINFKPDSNTLLYASATRGFKSGGFDMGTTTRATADAGFGPEKLWSYEVGAKGSWSDRKLNLNLSAFRYDYTDLQVTLFVPPSYALTQNAASARTYGVELEGDLRPYPGLIINGSLAYLDARYRHYPAAYSAAFGSFDASGKRLNNAPEWAYTIGATYTFTAAGGESYLGTDYRWQDDIYFSAANDGVGGVTGYLEQQRAYGLLNARLGWNSSDGRYGVSVVGRNLLDKGYVVSTASYTLAVAGRPGTPRTVEATVSVKW